MIPGADFFSWNHISTSSESDSDFERRKDWHDWFNGYVNQEAIQRPFFTIEEVFEELDIKREIVNNHIGFFFDSLST